VEAQAEQRQATLPPEALYTLTHTVEDHADPYTYRYTRPPRPLPQYTYTEAGPRLDALYPNTHTLKQGRGSRRWTHVYPNTHTLKQGRGSRRWTHVYVWTRADAFVCVCKTCTPATHGRTRPRHSNFVCVSKTCTLATHGCMYPRHAL
jgi:hypothetical protein